jgi:hypothetical protein
MSYIETDSNGALLKLYRDEIALLSKLAGARGVAIDLTPGRDGLPGDYRVDSDRGVDRRYRLSGTEIWIFGSSHPMSQSELKLHFEKQLDEKANK